MKQKTLYEFLGIDPEATPEEIKAAAQRLARNFHPSKYPGNTKVVARFKKIKLVYNILANPKKRAAYDVALAKKKAEAESIQNVVPKKTKSAPQKQKKDTEPAQDSTHKSEKEETEYPKKERKTVVDLLAGEKILYQISIHWFGYLKGLLIIGVAAYFLFIDLGFLEEYAIYKVDFFPELSYVQVGLYTILGWGVLTLLQTLFQQFTTILMITTKRIVAKFGLFARKQIEMNLTQFEHIEIKQNMLGKILGVGTLKVRGTKGRGVGGIKINLRNVTSPKQFEKRLIRAIKAHGYDE
ncbi:DnaJ domain-containing protein [Candidatus Parabeggiatoa sp. HSG14]|uniref:DnaJ domain-containing protein n=1 Tax=Candidatus Parabeggiatoa sp. HSG14 TaxID=3055593 RepID=UPI0025A9117A|nr:DnaJ domain-containing protein [Thiotrichales bacterium HSG14]